MSLPTCTLHLQLRRFVMLLHWKTTVILWVLFKNRLNKFYKCCIFLQREKNISKQQTLEVSNYMSELYIFSNPIDTKICYAGMLKYLSKKQSLKWVLEYAVYDLNWVMFLQKYYNYYLTSIPKKSLIYYQSTSSNNKLHSSMKP